MDPEFLARLDRISHENNQRFGMTKYWIVEGHDEQGSFLARDDEQATRMTWSDANDLSKRPWADSVTAELVAETGVGRRHVEWIRNLRDRSLDNDPV